MTSFFVYGITQFSMAHVNKSYELAILISILGICDGVYLSCLVPIVFEIANCPKLSNQLSGYYHSIIAIPVILGPSLSGKFYITKAHITCFLFTDFNC
jgi:hypothetical protein